ncbi:hypothetical protein H6F51_21365 [Cyanobacteria bacterium FACHB-DQ100]|nr:hypothetical protein [Cyanobacteria bacterium FACHB-DQ100]
MTKLRKATSIGFCSKKSFDWKRQDLQKLTSKQIESLALRVVPHKLAIEFSYDCDSDLYDRESFEAKVPHWPYDMEFALNHTDTKAWIAAQSIGVSSNDLAMFYTNAVKLICLAASYLSNVE